MRSASILLVTVNILWHPHESQTWKKCSEAQPLSSPVCNASSKVPATVHWSDDRLIYPAHIKVDTLNCDVTKTQEEADFGLQRLITLTPGGIIWDL